jgi:two-component system OmpR family sensor kinase
MSVWAIVTVAGLLAGAALAVRAALIDQRAVRLRAQAKPIIDRRLEHLDGQLALAELAAILAMDLASRDTTALVVDPDGRVLAAEAAGAGEPRATPLPAGRYAPAFAGEPHVTVREGGRLHVVIPPRQWLPSPPAVVHLVSGLGEERALLVRLTAGLLGGAALLALVEALGGGPADLLALVPVALVATRTARPPHRRASAPEPPPATERADFTAAMRRVEAAFLAREASEQRMRRFVADASHELRTPLTAVTAAADLLAGPAAEDAKQVRRLADVVRGQAGAMGALVEDLLTLARLDAGAGLELARVDLAALARAHAEQLALATPDRQITVDAPRPLIVSADERRVGQVIANLTANAVRHTAPGGTVSIAVRDGALTVADDGEGITPADLPRVFDRFFRAEAQRAGDGSGLGLAIVRELVEAHGGRVEAASRPGAGATFTVRLPTADRQEAISDA